MYSEKALEHFRNPKNVGEMEDTDAINIVGNPVSGDFMHISIKVKKNEIEDMSFQTFGCATAIATSSMITELAKGITLDEKMKITRNDVTDALDGLPPIKMYCSNLAAEGLHEAIRIFKSKQKK